MCHSEIENFIYSILKVVYTETTTTRQDAQAIASKLVACYLAVALILSVDTHTTSQSCPIFRNPNNEFELASQASLSVTLREPEGTAKKWPTAPPLAAAG